MTKGPEPYPCRSLGTSWLALKEIDADRTPMPNGGMRAIAQICDASASSAAALAGAASTGLGPIVAGNNAACPPVPQRVNGLNGAALAAVAAGAAVALSAAGSNNRTDKPAPAKSKTPNPAPAPKQPEPSPQQPASAAQPPAPAPTPTQAPSPPTPPPSQPTQTPPPSPPPYTAPPATGALMVDGVPQDWVSPQKV
jgi:outer membrane biosynthesis protein TonB